MKPVTPRQYTVLVGLTAVVLLSTLTGSLFAYATSSDTEKVSSSIAATADFTTPASDDVPTEAGVETTGLNNSTAPTENAPADTGGNHTTMTRTPPPTREPATRTRSPSADTTGATETTRPSRTETPSESPEEATRTDTAGVGTATHH